MKKILRAIPVGVCVVAAMIAAAVALVATPLARTLDGTPYFAVALGAGAVFAALAVGIPQLQRWQEQQEKKFRISVSAAASSSGIPFSTSMVEILAKVAVASREECLTPEVLSSSSVERGDVSLSASRDPGTKVRLSDLREIQGKQDAGQSLSEDEL